MLIYNREQPPTEEMETASCSIIDAHLLRGPAKAAARELELTRRMGQIDPSFECWRHTMMVQGRPVQVTFVIVMLWTPILSIMLCFRIEGFRHSCAEALELC